MSWHLTVVNRKGEEIASYGSIQMMDSDYYRLQGTHKGARKIAFFIKNFRQSYSVLLDRRTWEYEHIDMTEETRLELKKLCKKGNYIRVY